MEKQPHHIPRLMLAAPASGQGKTALACALLQAALWEGREPCAFKCGPDYIDPMFHRQVLGVPSRNLDLYFSQAQAVRSMLCAHSRGSSLAVIEGVMGYYDGIGASSQASSWHLAQATQTPAVLVLTPRGAALTSAAVVKGLDQFRTPSQIKGVLLNQCSEKMFRLLGPVIQREAGVRVFGYLPKLPECAIPSRHLGLVTAQEVEDLRKKVDVMARQMMQTVDLEGLFALADSAPDLFDPDDFKPLEAERVKIGVAQDRAFCFYYQENLDQLRSAGGELVPFSPLEDRALPKGVCGLYLGGGYPELYARELSENTVMRTAVDAAIQSGMPVLAECGGFLYLQHTLQDSQGRSWPMAGVLPGHGFPKGGLGRFGYLELTARESGPYLLPGERIRGHEFHHWDCTENGSACRAEKPAGDGWDCTVQYKNCFAGFPHLYFQSNPAFPARFVAQCRRFEEEST